MNDTIKIAIENGYEVKNAWGNSWQDMPVERILLDPLFWQALGKGLKWSKTVRCPSCRKVMNKQVYIGGQKQERRHIEIEEWLYFQHRFIDHLAEGKDIESFFTSLLTP